jgi:hypothetical protein
MGHPQCSRECGKKSWAFLPAAQIAGAIFVWLSCLYSPASPFPTSAVAMNAATLSRPLFERIHDALTTNPHVPSQLVRIEAEDGRVILKGNVKSFFQKQMAQEAVRRVDGVQQIDNLLQVNWA